MAQDTCSADGCDKRRLARGYCSAHYQRLRTTGDLALTQHRTFEPGVCDAVGCDEQRTRRRWCRNHYQRWKRYGDPLAGYRSPGAPLPPCSVEGCTAQTTRIIRGMCEMHYSRWFTKGDVGPVNSLRIIGDDDARFWSNVDKVGALSPHMLFRGWCWQWTGPRNRIGYGTFSVGNRNVGAHRWAYARFVEPVPDDFDVDHLCHNRGCVNYEQHLQSVPRSVNRSKQLALSPDYGWTTL